jgi:hypothetical protein
MGAVPSETRATWLLRMRVRTEKEDNKMNGRWASLLDGLEQGDHKSRKPGRARKKNNNQVCITDQRDIDHREKYE